MKYAILESGGKQYVAREGEIIEVDRLPLDIGKSITFDKVLLLVDGKGINIGAPSVQGAKVKGVVVDQIKSRKIIVFKYIPRERYRRKRGHRQQYTRVAIDSISLATPPEKGSEEEKKTKSKDAVKKKAEPEKKRTAAKSKTTKASTKEKPAASKSKSKSAKAESKPKSTSPKAKPKPKKADGK